MKNFRVGNYRFIALNDLEAISFFLKEILTYKITKTIKERSNCLLALSGGKTPQLLYELLNSETRIDWDKVYAIQIDERWVPLDHEDSNARMIMEKLPNLKNFNHVPYEKTAKLSATQYNNITTDLMNRLNRQSFDIGIFGMGEDTHTASLFPNSFDFNSNRMVEAYYVEQLASYRISMTPTPIQNGKENLVIFTGKEKAKAFREAHGVIDPYKHPIMLMPDTKTKFYVDYETAEIIRQ